MRLEVGAENSLFVHVTLAPILETVGEQKTKPTQHSVQELRRIGIQPDIIVVRSREPLKKDAKKKIALFTSVEESSVISDPDTKSVYTVPHILEKEGIVKAIESRLRLNDTKLNWGEWEEIANSFISASKGVVKIAMVGKYVTLADSYVSVNHALMHSAARLGYKLEVDWLDSEEFEQNPSSLSILNNYHGILVPGGFGKRGSEGKMLVANYARENKIPFLGICFGFQIAVVSFARNVAGLKDANSTELNPNTPHPVVDLLPEQKKIHDLGGTMRLGGHDIEIIEGTIAHKIYGRTVIRERHRHRYEVNPEYIPKLKSHGLVFSAFSDNGLRAEILEIPNHPFYIATQYHPEFISRPGKPEPIYLNFVLSATKRISEW
jgi:CTP synthase